MWLSVIPLLLRTTLGFVVVPPCRQPHNGLLRSSSSSSSRDEALKWNLAWPADTEEEERSETRPLDVFYGAVLFVTCHLNGLVLTQQQEAGRVLGTAAFLALQRPVPLGDMATKFQWTQKIGPVPWPAAALGASAPYLAALGLSLVSDGGTYTLHAPDLQLDTALLGPVTEEIVFRVWAIDAAKAANLPYIPTIVVNGILFGLWHGIDSNSIGLAALGAYWAHLYAQSQNALLPTAMHLLWNLFVATNIASISFPPR